MKKIFKDALTLGLSNAVITGAGFLFSLYISRVLGTEGVGLYQLVLSVYVLCATFATSGISLSVTRLVSEAMCAEKTKAEVKKIMRHCFLFAASVGGCAGLFMFSLSVPAATYVLHNSELFVCLRILSFGLMFMSLCSCFHGYFIGVRRAIKSAAASIAEDFAKMAVVIAVMALHKPQSLVEGCEIICLGLVISEAVSCGCSLCMYLVKKPSGNAIPKKTVPKLLKIAAPVAVSSYLRSGLTTLENILIPAGLVKAGYTLSQALSLFGSMKGLVVPLLFFPASFLWAFSKVLVPEVAAAFTLGDNARINKIGSRVIKTTLLCAVPVTLFFLAFANPIGKYIFRSAEAGHYLFLLAPLVPMMYLDGVVDSILKGMNEQVAVMRYNIIEAAVRVFLVWIVLPATGFEGLVMIIYAGNAVNAVLSLRRLCKITDIGLRKKNSHKANFLPNAKNPNTAEKKGETFTVR